MRAWAVWTRDFIRAFGWREYVRVVWIDTAEYRLRTWRCWLGHELGEEEEERELGWYVYSVWRSCQRPHCEYMKRVD